jgi:phosphatidate cytidylyltransferase
MSKFTGPSALPNIASKTAFDALNVDSGEETEEEHISDQDSHSAADSAEPMKPTKSSIKKAHKIARIERKKRQKLEAREKAKLGLSDEALTPDEEPVASLVEEGTTGQNEDRLPSEPLEIPRPVPPITYVPAEVPADCTVTATSLNGVPLPPPPEPLDNAGPAVGTGAVDVVDVISGKRVPQPESVANVASKSPLEAEKVKKRQNFLNRVVYSLVMIGGFIALLLLGHAYMILLVMLCQALVYREVTALFSLKSQTSKMPDPSSLKAKDPWSKTLNWYFFAVTNYFLYGESIIYYFKHVVFADANLLPFATNHRIISFTLYTIGFMGFVMSLKKGYLKQQFGLFCWVHMTLLLIVVSSHFIVNNILEGLIWFWVPASLVICNDCFAYIWGVTMGRTPLIKLSPKKTVEGFVGAFISTVIFAVLWGTYFMRFDYMICPVQDLGVHAWSGMTCKPNPIFVWKQFNLWPPVSMCLSMLMRHPVQTISYAPYQVHLLLLAFFASLVAPFGGFFASGFKRAFDIKDFGDSIPGHGGMTDRMDCQFLMGVFTYVYYSSLIRQYNVNVGGVLQTIVSGLSFDEQLELMRDLKKYLESQGLAVTL